MLEKFSKVLLLSLLLSILPFSVQTASAVDILWQPGVGNDLSGAAPGLIPGAGIRGTGLLVYKENPDLLIMKIIMNESFEDKPFSSKGRNMAMWIYWPKDYCWGENERNCSGLFTISIPNSPASYPTVKSNEYVFAFSHDKEANVNRQVTSCKAPWWIENTYKSRDTWAFALSITCLGIPKNFGWYAYSSIDLGQSDVVTNFTSVQSISYPFHELAKPAYASVTSTQEKTELINQLKNLAKSGNLQSKGVKSSIIKSKTLSSAKKKTYQTTVKRFDEYSKTLGGKISELEALPYGENFRSTGLKLVADYQAWLKKLIDILSAVVKN
jgi:ligand-binding SRPBCC domain-containing protein